MSREWFVNTTTVAMTALHTRNAMTEGSTFGRGAYFTRPSPTVMLTGNIEQSSVLQYTEHHCQSTTMTGVWIGCSVWTIVSTRSVVFKCVIDCRQLWTYVWQNSPWVVVAVYFNSAQRSMFAFVLTRAAGVNHFVWLSDMTLSEDIYRSWFVFCYQLDKLSSRCSNYLTENITR